MQYQVRLPNLKEESGDDSASDEATITYWHYEEGDRVVEGEDLVEMTTDKAAFNVPCPLSGILAEILAEEGDLVKVGEVLGIIEQE